MIYDTFLRERQNLAKFYMTWSLNNSRWVEGLLEKGMSCVERGNITDFSYGLKNLI